MTEKTALSSDWAFAFLLPGSSNLRLTFRPCFSLLNVTITVSEKGMAAYLITVCA